MEPKLRYPEWQKLCVDATAELDLKKRPERLAAAEAAIAKRIQELAASPDGHEERLAIDDALNTLRFLKRDSLPG
jgi:hypothetical protein